MSLEILDGKLVWSGGPVIMDPVDPSGYKYWEFYIPRFIPHGYFCVDECDFEDSWLEDVEDHEYRDHDIVVTRGCGYGMLDISVWDARELSEGKLTLIQASSRVSHKVNLKDSIALDTNKAGLFVSILESNCYSIRSYDQKSFEELVKMEP